MYRQSVLLPQDKEILLNGYSHGFNDSLHRRIDENQEHPNLKKPSSKNEKEGVDKAQVDFVKDINSNRTMFDDVVKRSSTILLHAKTIFPFDFFTSDLIIDITKVTLVSRRFFLSGYTQSIHVRDIMDVIVSTGPFLSSLTVLDLGYLQRNKLYVKHLKRSDALHARQIIEGLIAACKAGVDLTKIPRRELLPRLPELLRSQSTPQP